LIDNTHKLSRRKKIPSRIDALDDFPEAVRVTDVLDLHGFFPEQIPEVLDEFIKNAHSLRLKTLRIIHGKGKSRLKFEVLRFLKDCPSVSRYYDAFPESGGWGATVVEVK
jgi:DNA-nicking Smr family endonuclease